MTSAAVTAVSAINCYVGVYFSNLSVTITVLSLILFDDDILLSFFFLDGFEENIITSSITPPQEKSNYNGEKDTDRIFKNPAYS